MDSLSLLHLSLIHGFGPGIVEKILKTIPAATDLYTLTALDFKMFGVHEKAAQQLVKGLQDKVILETELNLIRTHAISWTTILDRNYPDLLKETYLPPLVLYWQGDLSFRQKTVALVGSRAANNYGGRVTKQIVSGLVSYGVTTVSGGAYGIDTWVHRATLDEKGKTIAVLGSGLLKPYPVQNKKLFEEIVYSGGAVVSSFPLMMEALPGNFPARNRIISGLSSACIVVQAAEKSGALITADYALNQGRLVGAVPGSIDDPLSAGSHKLLKNGAFLVQNAGDIMEELGVNFEGKMVTEAQDVDPLVLFCAQPIGFEDLLQASKIPEDELNDRLFSLQLDGKIEQNFAGLWQSI